MKFKPYPKYKISRIEWLGEIPNEWTIKRLGHISAQEKNAFVDGPFGSDLKTDDYKDDGIPLIQLNNIKEGEHVLKNMKFITEAKKQQLSRHVAKSGDVVIAKMADPVARATLVNNDYEEYVIVADCVKMTPNKLKINRNFLIYSINSKNVRTGAELVSTGTTRIRINLTELKKLWIPYPPIQEQTAIANFLDRETHSIDALVEEKNRFIELLKEKRQALIGHVVTKGLDPTVKMKDSGVEWLGEVSEHWKVLTAKRVSNIFIPQRNKPDLNQEGEGVYWVTMDDMKDDEILQTNLCVSADSAKIAGSKCLAKGAVIASCVGNFGIASINLVDVIINQQLQAFVPKKAIIAKFIFYSVVRSKAYFEQVGTSTTLTYVNQQGFENLPLTLSSIEEQTDIVNFLDHQTAKIDALITETQVSIELLKEHRTALISAAVTGKIDVRKVT